MVLGGYAVSRRSKHWPGWFRAGRSDALTSSMMAWAGWSPPVASQAQTSARSWCEPGMLRRSSGTQGTMYRLRKRRGPMGLASGRERRSPLGNIVLIAGGSRCKLLLRTARSKAMFQIAGASIMPHGPRGTQKRASMLSKAISGFAVKQRLWLPGFGHLYGAKHSDSTR
jgi:hypothetical protein